MPPNPASKPGASSIRSKDQLRLSAAAAGFTPADSGILAQHLRGLPAYQAARQLLVAPVPLLKQIRINALLDGKSLLMPAPGLLDGFYLFTPFTIPFPDLPLAVTNKGLARFARKLPTAELGSLQLQLLVSDALTVADQGTILGDGHGFFDLATAILATAGALAPGYQVVAVGPTPEGGELLLADPWDISADHRLTPAGLSPCRPANPRPVPTIAWDLLPPVRIRRITPMWQLKQNPQDKIK